MIITQPTDETVLSTLAHTLRLLRADKDLALCYENALQVMPNNEGFMRELFFAYLKLSETKKMQLLGQRLFKSTNNSEYVFWSVCSMLQQNDLPPAMLTVADRMIRKVLYESSTLVRPGTS